MPAVSVGVAMVRLPLRPNALTTAPVSRRSRLTVCRVMPRSTVRREFWRTLNDALPSTKMSLDAGPVAISSPVWMVCCGAMRRPLSNTSPTSSTTLLRCCAMAAGSPPMATQAAAALRVSRRWNHVTSPS